MIIEESLHLTAMPPAPGVKLTQLASVRNHTYDPGLTHVLDDVLSIIALGGRTGSGRARKPVAEDYRADSTIVALMSACYPPLSGCP